MTRPRLFGTTTSPYVRRVRILALELGVDYEWIDAAPAEGQALLRELNPLWKVPAMFIGDQPLLDSGLINRYLLANYGPGPLTPFDADDLASLAFTTVTDGALDASINAFYLTRDGARAEDVAYVDKQMKRVASALEWLERRSHQLSTGALGLREIALITALDWMKFRNAYPIERHPQLVAACEKLRDRPSILSTMPNA